MYPLTLVKSSTKGQETNWDNMQLDVSIYSTLDAPHVILDPQSL